MNDIPSNPELAISASKPATAPAMPGAPSTERMPGSNSRTMVHAAAQLNHALGEPVSERMIGFFEGLWAVIVSFFKSIWQSVEAAWKPGNYLALVCFFLAGVLLSDFTLRYVRTFTVVAVVLVGVLFIATVLKKANR